MMKRTLTLFSLLVVASTAFAQTQINVGDLIDLEERVLYKKMSDELNKPNPNAPPPAVPMPRAPKVIHRTETLAVYGTTATFLEGQLSMGGRTYTVRKGMLVQDFVVTAVQAHGITLTRNRTGGGRKALAPLTVFAPMAH